MRNVAEVLRDPLIGIHGVEVAFPAVMKDEGARRAPRDPVLHPLYRHEHPARRATRENGLTPHQAATPDDTVEVRHAHTLLGQAGPVELGASGRAVARNEPL